MRLRARPLQDAPSNAPANLAPDRDARTFVRATEARPTGGEIDLERVALLYSAEQMPGAMEPFLTSGRSVAATGLTRALARYAGIPHLEIYGPIRGLETCHQHLRSLPSDIYGGEPARASLSPESDLPARLGRQRYDVLHDPTGISFGPSTYLRSRFSREIFPITASQMGMSYSFDVTRAFIPLLTAPIYPCDAIVCSTEASREAIARRLPDLAERYCGAWGHPTPPLPRLELIPWGVDTERFAPRNRAQARRDLDLPLDRCVILCVSRLRIEDKMDATPLLLAFERVRALSPHCPLFAIAGTAYGSAGDQVMATARQLGLTPHLRTFFNLPPANLATLYAASDVFVAPTDSLTESFGLTIIEAMAAGLPVVASDWNGYKELIVHGETGFKVRTDWADCLGEMDLLAPALEWVQEHLHVGQSVSIDVGELATHLKCLVENPARREEMGRRGRLRAEALYRWPVVVEQWLALWRELGAIAASLPRQEADRLEYLRPHYFRHFSHYASRIIDDTVSVQITPRGRAVQEEKAPLSLHPWASGILKPEILRSLLSSLRASRWLHTRLSVGELLEVLYKGSRVSRDLGLMHLMWLAKYDLISLESPDVVKEP